MRPNEYAEKLFLSRNITVWRKEYLENFAAPLFDTIFNSL